MAKINAIALAIALIAGLGQPVAAQRSEDDEESGVSVRVRSYFAGYYDPTRWMGLVVDLENEGDDRRIDIVVTGQGRTTPETRVPVEMPHQSAKSVPIYVWGDPLLNGLEVRVLSEGESLASRSVRVQPTYFPLVALFGYESDVEGLIGFAPPGLWHVTPLKVPPEGIPTEPLALGSVDVVLASRSLSELNAAQVESLRKWVALGGLLVLPGGPPAVQNLGAVPEAMRPARVTGVGEVTNLRPLLPFLRKIPFDGAQQVIPPPPGPFEIIHMEPLEGGVIAAGLSSTPLIIARQYGHGSVIALAFDPFEDSLQEWRDLPFLFRGISLDPRGSVWTSLPTADISLSPEMTRLGQQAAPPVSTVALLFGAFVFAVGPANYFVLRRRRRLELAWVTIPAITLVASSGAYALGSGSFGRALRVERVSVIEVIGDTGVAYASTVTGIFSPAEREYDIRLEEGLVHPQLFSNLVDGPQLRPKLLQGASPGLGELRVPQWTMTAFASEAVLDWPVIPEPRLEKSGPHVVARVGNPLGVETSDVTLVLPGNTAPLPPLTAGGQGDDPNSEPQKFVAAGGIRQTVELAEEVPEEQIGIRGHLLRRVTLPAYVQSFGEDQWGFFREGEFVTHRARDFLGSFADEYYEYSTGPRRGRPDELSRDVATELLRGRPILLGWTDDSPIDVTVSGGPDVQHDTTLVYRRFSGFRPPTDEISGAVE